mmetsp:Transcript_46177/g.143047  ORF Transcript_46177/g.143047 Transcript_46177/m.143047 type:complete len:359 (+) Transcript_46177:1145-2221(+)
MDPGRRGSPQRLAGLVLVRELARVRQPQALRHWQRRPSRQRRPPGLCRRQSRRRKHCCLLLVAWPWLLLHLGRSHHLVSGHGLHHGFLCDPRRGLSCPRCGHRHVRLSACPASRPHHHWPRDHGGFWCPGHGSPGPAHRRLGRDRGPGCYHGRRRDPGLGPSPNHGRGHGGLAQCPGPGHRGGHHRGRGRRRGHGPGRRRGRGRNRGPGLCHGRGSRHGRGRRSRGDRRGPSRGRRIGQKGRRGHARRRGHRIGRGHRPGRHRGLRRDRRRGHRRGRHRGRCRGRPHGRCHGRCRGHCRGHCRGRHGRRSGQRHDRGRAHYRRLCRDCSGHLHRHGDLGPGPGLRRAQPTAGRRTSSG